MKAIVNTNITTQALTVKKENSLAIIHNVVFNTIRISTKSLFAAIALTLLNLVI